MRVYEGGALSEHLATMPLGDGLAFKHIPFNVKTQYPFEKKLGMIAGGTGITPALQALHAVLGAPGDSTEVSLVYGSKTADDILAADVLDAWAAAHPRLSVTHVLSAEPADSAWTGARGFVDADLVAARLPAPGDGQIFVCGPEPMYDALCGPRGDPELTGVLREMGYEKEEVVKF